ncbi:MAG TPA: TlpA disulfide reductase family protein [Casimicrobiaceae bacterium]|jgi:peroxiredoxin
MRGRRGCLPGMRTVAAAALLAFALNAYGLAPGEPAPAFALTDGDGKTLSLASLRGRVVYVDFWASWCTPCRRSFPWMNAMQLRHGTEGLTVVGVNVDKHPEDAARFLADVPATFTVVYDASGATPSAYGVKGMPSSFLIDRRGNVMAIEDGFHDERRGALETQIESALRER